MKKILTLLMTVTTSLAFMLCSCGGNESLTKNIEAGSFVMNGYETYGDLEKILMNDAAIQGEAKINTDKKYVTQGNGSLLLKLDYNSEFTSSGVFGTKMSYMVNRYDDKFTALEYVKEISVDIYNANDEQFDFYFGAYGEQDYLYFNDGNVLVPNSWNHITVPVKQWFVEDGTTVKEYRMFFDGITQLKDKKADFYIDNFSFTFAAKPSIPEVYDGNGIMDLNSPRFLDAFLVKQAVDAYEFLPFSYLKHNPKIAVGEKTGGFEFTFGRTHAWGDVYVSDDEEEGADNNGYDLILHRSVVEKIKDCKQAAVTVRNPNAIVCEIILITGNNGNNMAKKFIIGANETETVSAELPENIDYFAIRISSWNVIERNTLYFRDLTFVK